MTDWKNPEVVLKVPKGLAKEIRKIAAKEYPPKNWCTKARELLYGYVAMHRARGAIEE